MRREVFAIVLLLGIAIESHAQGTPGTLRCAFSGGMDINATREPSSPVVTKIKCGDSVLLIDQRFGSAHVRTEDGKDGFIIGINFGQWRFEPEGVPANATPAPVAVPPASRTATPNAAPTTAPIIRAVQNFEVFGGYSLMNQGAYGVTDTLPGWNASIAARFNTTTALVADVGGYYGNNVLGYNGQAFTYKFGPRFSLPLTERVSTFVQVLGGGVTAHVNLPNVTYSGLAISGGGGIDLRVAERWSVRPVQIEYAYHHVQNLNIDGMRLSSGIVFRFGGE